MCWHLSANAKMRACFLCYTQYHIGPTTYCATSYWMGCRFGPLDSNTLLTTQVF